MKGLEKLIESYFLLLSIYLIIVATIYILYNGKYENNKESEINNNKFKDYEEVKVFLEENYSFVKYKNEDIKRLIILIYFGWKIKDYSNLNNLVLKRKEEILNFKPKSKNIEMRY